MAGSQRYTDQACNCGAKVTAKQRSQGTRQFYEFVVIGYLDRVQRVTLCTDCQVRLELLFGGKIESLHEYTA